MRNSVILEVTNDKFEHAVNFYYTTEELAFQLHSKPSNIQARINRPPKKTKTKYIRVWLNEEKYKMEN